MVSSVSEAGFSLDELRPMPRPHRVLLTTPEYFAVEYVINPHMKGNIGTVNLPAAHDQWDILVATYRKIGMDVSTIRGQEGFPDMVFCANQALPFISEDLERRGVVISTMHAPQRQGEVHAYKEYFESIGYESVMLSGNVVDFEGMGDAIWHPGRRLIWGGHGFRTSPNAYEEIAAALDVPIITLRLDDPEFYHLDTCLSVLSETDAIVYPPAFNDDGMALISRYFSRLVVVPEHEGRDLFAANAHCPDEKHVIIQRGCTETVRSLRDLGYVPIEVDTSEYLKAGGSVYCMKQMYW